jgi:ribosomal protein S18 acetylase RimI-like enzyme
MVTMIDVRAALPGDLPAAVEVWHAANTARGLPPTASRLSRIREKLTAPDATVLVATLPATPLPASLLPAVGPPRGAVVGMALVEPGRTDDGAGEPVPGYGHVSMVFVHPSHWSNGYGRRLLRAVHALGWTRTTLWTRQSNSRAQRLYAAAGYTPTGRAASLSDGDAIIQLEHLTA